MRYSIIISCIFIAFGAINWAYLRDFEKHYTHEICGLNTTAIEYYGDGCLNAKFRSTILKTGKPVNLKYPTYATFFDCMTQPRLKIWEEKYLAEECRHSCYINKKIGFGYIWDFSNGDRKSIYDKYMYGLIFSSIVVTVVLFANFAF